MTDPHRAAEEAVAKEIPFYKKDDEWYWRHPVAFVTEAKVYNPEIVKVIEAAVRREEVIQRVISFLFEWGFLKKEHGLKIVPKDTSKKGHGSCCYCQECGFMHDDCVCEHNRFVSLLDQALQEKQ